MSSITYENEVKEFYGNDVVYRFDKQKKIRFGVVVESYESSDSDSGSRALQKGQIRVFWLNNYTEQVWRQSKVKLMSRSVIPGDIVRRLEHGKETQRGYCRFAKQYASVQIVGTDKVIENISQDRLSNLLSIDYDMPVCLGTKFGRIRNFEQKITMSSKCGSVVEVFHSINSDIEDYWLTKNHRNFIDQYHSGQEVTLIPSTLEQPNWINKSKSMKRNFHNRQRFTVQKVDVSNVEISWHANECTNASGVANTCDIKDEDINKLKLLDNVESKFLELAERRLLKISSSDLIIKKRDWILKQSALCRPDLPKVLHVVKKNTKRSASRLRRRPSLLGSGTTSVEYQMNHCTTGKGEVVVEVTDGNGVPMEGTEDEEWSTDCTDEDFDLDEMSENGSTSSTTSATKAKKKKYPPRSKELLPGRTTAVETLCMDSKATIVWQDGTEEKDIPTTQLYYSISLDNHEFFPGEWVTRSEKYDKYAEPQTFGVVQKVDYLERTATIKWFSLFTSLDPDNKSTENCTSLNTEIHSVYDISKHPKYSYRPGSNVYGKPLREERLGTVVDSYPEGYVLVKWICGDEERCYPNQIELIPEGCDLDDMSEDFDDDDALGATPGGDVSCLQVSWETESVESIPGDLSMESALQNVASRLDFLRNRIVHLKEALKHNNIPENIAHLRDLLTIYDNSSYLDRLLETSFFSQKSKHYQAILAQVKERAKQCGIKIRGRLFSSCEFLHGANVAKIAERENINNILKLEVKINAQVENAKEVKDTRESGEPSTPITSPISDTEPSSTPATSVTDGSQLIPCENLCIELISMLKVRMDLAYAEIVARIGGTQALSVMTRASEVHVHSGASETTGGAAPGTPTSSAATPMPSFPTTPEDSFTSLTTDNCCSPKQAEPEQVLSPKATSGSFTNKPYLMLDEVHTTHKYYSNKIEHIDRQKFYKALQNEHRLLRESLPPGVWVRTYSDRTDLLSIMIAGPARTPYEDGLFCFDVQLGADYPRAPPVVHYLSYSTERLNPNLYVEGRVCISLLGTWMGRGTEVWGTNSTLLQLIVSIQGLILVAEPYYNEAGYEKQTTSQQGYENSRTYNEHVVLKLVQSMTDILASPPEVFRREICGHFLENGQRLRERLKQIINEDNPPKPDFPLLPVSKGLKLSLNSALDKFQNALKFIVDRNLAEEDL